jgi:hypothetical protein
MKDVARMKGSRDIHQANSFHGALGNMGKEIGDAGSENTNALAAHMYRINNSKSSTNAPTIINNNAGGSGGTNQAINDILNCAFA